MRYFIESMIKYKRLQLTFMRYEGCVLKRYVLKIGAVILVIMAGIIVFL